MQTLMTDGGGRWPRWLKFLGLAVKNPAGLLRVLTVKNWSERNRHHLGDAEPGQLHHHVQKARATRSVFVEQAGTRRAQSDMDPGRQ
jgi:hypothetical protein